MMDSISEIQSRIADIQGRIAELSPAAALTGAPAAGSAGNDPNANFAQALAAQRARFGTQSVPGDTSAPSTLTPSSLLPALPPQPIGRRPYVPPAPPLPRSTPALSGSAGAVKPFVPVQTELVPIKTGSAGEYGPIIDRYAAANGVSPSLVRAVIRTESDGNPRTVSRAGAMGLMQLMPDNVREAGIDDPFDPEQNIAAGTKQLAGLLHQYHGNLDLALAGYNAGPGNVRKYGGVPPFRETHDYIRKVRMAMGE